MGLTEEELTYLAKSGSHVIKTSRRDIPIIVSKGLDGATTVSATMYIASLAKIKIFATGGIGGVHRGAEITMDISADLDEFAKTKEFLLLVIRLKFFQLFIREIVNIEWIIKWIHPMKLLKC